MTRMHITASRRSGSLALAALSVVWPSLGSPLALLTGALLVVAEPEGHRDAAYLAAAVVERGITVLQLVPTMLGPFLDQKGVETAKKNFFPLPMIG